MTHAALKDRLALVRDALKPIPWAKGEAGKPSMSDTVQEALAALSAMEGEAVVEITGVDEYGPMLAWSKHWSGFPVGTKLYTAPPPQQAVVEAVLDRPARVGGRDFLAGQLVQQVVGRAHAEYDRFHHPTPSPGPQGGGDDPAEAAYWRFDARHKGYGWWRRAPMSERDAFKAEYRAALAAAPKPAATEGKGDVSEWDAATRIATHDDVDDVLRDFAADPTGDNGVMVVREVMRVLAKPAADGVTEAVAKVEVRGGHPMSVAYYAKLPDGIVSLYMAPPPADAVCGLMGAVRKVEERLRNWKAGGGGNGQAIAFMDRCADQLAAALAAARKES